MSEHRPKPDSNKSDKTSLLDDLQDLSGMLDEPMDMEEEPSKPYGLEDLPVLKSFVEDVPTLSDTLNNTEEHATTSPDAPTSILDDSFVDDDPLAISSSVRQQLSNEQLSNEQSNSRPNKPAPELTPTAASPAIKPVTPSSDNPFLPKSALDRLNASATDAIEPKASQELRSLIKQRSLPKFDTNSKEFLALRSDASKMVNEVIKLFIPRMEAELRMRLEKEIDEYLKELRKNAED